MVGEPLSLMFFLGLFSGGIHGLDFKRGQERKLNPTITSACIYSASSLCCRPYSYATMISRATWGLPGDLNISLEEFGHTPPVLSAK